MFSLRVFIGAVAVAALVTARPGAQQSTPSSASPPPAAGAQSMPRPGIDQPAVTFKVEVNYVEVDAAVFDKSGKFVGTLTKDDFQVFEDGQPQDISAFTLVNIPIERADRPLYSTHPVQADVASNAKPFEGRLYVVVLDDLHTQPYHSIAVRNAAKQFIDRYMGDNDLAAVVHSSGKGNASQEFTSNKRLLDASVDKFLGQSLQSVTLARLDQYQRDQAVPVDPTSSSVGRVKDPFDQERAYRARQSLDNLKSISDWIGSIRGRRKAIVWVSEGIDYDLFDFTNNRDTTSVQEAIKDVIASATRSNVSIYAVDPRGLTMMGDTSIEAQGAFPDNPDYGLSNQSFMDELRTQQQSLRTLGEDTGGYAAVNMNDFSKAWDRVVADSSNYYVLGYYPTNERRDGRYRKIEVRVKGEGLDVRYRKGYNAPKGKPPAPSRTVTEEKASPQVREAINSPVPLPGLRIKAYAAPFKGIAPNASIAVGVEAAGADLAFQPKDGKFVNDVELSVVAIDTNGKIKDGDRTLLNMGLKPETQAKVAQDGLRMQTRLKIPPGRYQLRFAARETGSGHIGSVTYDIDVPDFAKEPLSMSGILLAAASKQQLITAKPDEELKNVLPAAPTATREFPVGDTLAMFVEVYDNDVKTPHKVNITTKVLADDGHEVFTNTAERDTSELGGSKSGGFGHLQEVSLKGFAPGLYVLKVEAKSSVGKNPATTMREIPFTVK
jgi:VWFA-related protein